MHVISKRAYVSPLAHLECSVHGSRLVVGPDCMIDAFVKIKFAGGVGNVVIGDRTHLNSGTAIYSGNGIRIGTTS